MSWRPILRTILHPKRTAEQTALLQHQVAVISEERDQLKDTLARMAQYAPPGHFYSPIPSKEDVEDQLLRNRRLGLLRPLPAVQMDDKTQLSFLEHLQPFYPNVPFQFEAKDGLLYQYDNPHFTYSDAILLFCVMNHYRPARMIEIGSGFSTCVTLDTNRLFLNSRTELTSIEPHAKLLRDLITQSHDHLTIIESKLQEVQLEVFDQLCAGDILFVDSTHVSKAGSDVNYVIFEILPRLKPGVIVHIHDIYLAYEYPDVWLREGRAWNESYLLRAFLEYNEHFRILLFVSYMQNAHEDWFQQNMPDTLLGKGGSFWMEKA